MKELKIGFVLANYNNSRFTREAVRSISLNRDWDNCCVVIVDNNSNAEDVALLKQIQNDYPGIRLILNRENKGYFGGLNVGIKYLREQETPVCHIVVGNNDLFFPDNFIVSIRGNLDKFESHAVISPDIINSDGAHQNPHVIKEIGKFREMIYDLYFLNYYLAVIIRRIAVATKRFTDRKDEEQFGVAQTIYQGYGACYILGPLFFRNFESLWAPTFLMGEELFLSRQLAGRNLNVYYEPSIVVNHCCHATTKGMTGRKYWEISRDAHKVYRKYVKIWR